MIPIIRLLLGESRVIMAWQRKYANPIEPNGQQRTFPELLCDMVMIFNCRAFKKPRPMSGYYKENPGFVSGNVKAIYGLLVLFPNPDEDEITREAFLNIWNRIKPVTVRSRQSQNNLATAIKHEIKILTKKHKSLQKTEKIEVPKNKNVIWHRQNTVSRPNMINKIMEFEKENGQKEEC